MVAAALAYCAVSEIDWDTASARVAPTDRRRRGSWFPRQAAALRAQQAALLRAMLGKTCS
jgi:hypothetical protein